jgi:CHAT domain-containing protein
MNNLLSAIKKINQQVKLKHWEEAQKAGEDLWGLPYEGQLTDSKLRNQYIDALKKLAEIYTDFTGDALSGSNVFKRVYELADEHLRSPERASDKEYAAFKLGSIYEAARLPHSAVHWYKRTLDLARERQDGEYLLFNLYLVAWSYETLGDLVNARMYYDEILEISAGLNSYEECLDWIIPAAMFQIRYADSAKGEELFLSLANTLWQSNEEQLPDWFFVALYALGKHYITTQRSKDAIKLARMVMDRSARFEDQTSINKMLYGLIAKAHLHSGKLDEALNYLNKVYPVDSSEMVSYGGEWADILKLWADIARIHTARGDYLHAFAAYESLAYNLGSFIINARFANTSRKRYYWLQQQTLAVHEMVSAWLEIQNEKMRTKHEAQVANAMLQMKANLFLSIEANRLDVLQVYEGLDLVYFDTNRAFASTARRVMDNPEDIGLMLELEDALFSRERLEQQMITGDIIPVPRVARMLSFDFRQSAEIGDDILLDYSVVNYRPPVQGLAGPVIDRRYIGVMLEGSNLQIIDLGKAENIEPLCSELIRRITRQPNQAIDSPKHDIGRNLRPTNLPVAEGQDNIEAISENVFDRIIAPFASVNKSVLKKPLIFSPDGILAGLPFHALVYKGQFLIEERDIVYCHSLLQRESLSRRQLSPGRQMVPDININAVLLGDPDYQQTRLSHLPGTELEVKRIGNILKKHLMEKGVHTFDEVNILTGAQATVSQLLKNRFPNIVHIAAHGGFSEIQGYQSGREPTLDGGYRWLEEMAVWPLSQLDLALLRPNLVLSAEKNSTITPMDGEKKMPDTQMEGRILTALEISALNLIGCNLVVLSACDTGVGITLQGAGILGFQYALTVSSTRAGIVSLWKVLDQETSEFMVDFYRNFLDQRDPKAGYLETVRKHCRINHKRVHPYYWAAFSFLDLDYYHPVF